MSVMDLNILSTAKDIFELILALTSQISLVLVGQISDQFCLN